MLKYIKTKLSKAWQWTKAKAKWLLIATGILGVASAGFLGTPIKVIPSITFNGNAIVFPYTDDNTGEDLIIRTSQETYGGWQGSDVYFSVTNISAVDELVSVQMLFGNNEKLTKIEELKKDVVYQVTIEDYGSRDFTCATNWTATSTVGRIEYQCGTELKYCDTVSGNICTRNRVKTGEHKENRQRDEWKPLNLERSNKFDDKRITEARFKSSKKAMYLIPKGQTKFFKSYITFLPKQRNEFMLEAKGINGAKGILK